MVKIGIAGRGGQGIVYLGRLIGSVALEMGLYSAVTSSYGAEVRGGSVLTNVVLSKEEIINPYIEEFDYIIILESIGWEKIKRLGEARIIADKVLAWRDNIENVDWRDFDRYSHQMNLPINMIVAGYLVRLGVIDYHVLRSVVERSGRNIEKNLKAIKIGFKEV